MHRQNPQPSDNQRLEPSSSSLAPRIGAHHGTDCPFMARHLHPYPRARPPVGANDYIEIGTQRQDTQPGTRKVLAPPFPVPAASEMPNVRSAPRIALADQERSAAWSPALSNSAFAHVFPTLDPHFRKSPRARQLAGCASLASVFC